MPGASEKYLCAYLGRRFLKGLTDRGKPFLNMDPILNKRKQAEKS